MATAATTYFGNRARVAVVAAGGTPALADLFTVDRGFEATLAYQVAELYGTDDIHRVDEAKYEFKPTAKLRGCKFYPDNAGTGGITDMIFNSLFGATACDGTVPNNNNLYLMDVYIYQTGSDTPATNRFCVKMVNCYLEGPTIPFPENDFIILDLTFHGRDASIISAAVPVA